MRGLSWFVWLWTRASVLTGFAWALLYGGGSKLAEAGLMVLLLLLLIGGVVLLFLGTRDAIHDFQRFLHNRKRG